MSHREKIKRSQYFGINIHVYRHNLPPRKQKLRPYNRSFPPP